MDWCPSSTTALYTCKSLGVHEESNFTREDLKSPLSSNVVVRIEAKCGTMHLNCLDMGDRFNDFHVTVGTDFICYWEIQKTTEFRCEGWWIHKDGLVGYFNFIPVYGHEINHKFQEWHILWDTI